MNSQGAVFAEAPLTNPIFQLPMFSHLAEQRAGGGHVGSAGGLGGKAVGKGLARKRPV